MKTIYADAVETVEMDGPVIRCALLKKRFGRPPKRVAELIIRRPGAIEGTKLLLAALAEAGDDAGISQIEAAQVEVAELRRRAHG